MKRRLGKNVVIPIILIIIIFAIVYCLTQNKADDTVRVEPAVYQDLLAKYERALEDPSYPEYRVGLETPDGLYDWIFRCIGHYPVCYCIKDLNDDGKEELILGYVGIKTPLELFGRIYDEACQPFVIYTYEDEDIKLDSIAEEYIMILYEGGIVELISGGVRGHFMYFQVGETERPLDTIVEERDQEEGPRYYRCIDADDGRTTEYADITEEEFHAIRNRYATTVEVLDWKPLDGFWEPGERGFFDAVFQ